MTRTLVRAMAVVFIASFCTLVIELVAGRIMAPYVGVSLYTWTSIIGTVLAGISMGAWIGGILADRFPRPSLLGWLLLASGAAALSIPPVVDLIGAGAMLSIGASLMTRVLVLSAFSFFVPSLLLGMISPAVVKLTLNDLDHTGNIVGKIYAFSTLGSIIGTFATGFFLIDWLGTRTLILCVAGALIACAFALGSLFERRVLAAAALFAFVLACAAAASQRNAIARTYDELLKAPAAGAYYYKDSNYFTIRVHEFTRADGAGKLQTLMLDHLVHSFNDLDDPSYLAYRYLRIVHSIVRAKAGTQPEVRLLFLGGGGYTLPRFLAGAYPNVTIDVVEIDPEVTRVAQRFLGVKPNPRLRTINEDARWYLMRSKTKYDVIFCDAFADISIPWHLTTVEFAGLLAGHLRHDGVVAANVIDNFQRGRFLPSYFVTLEKVFGRGHVALLSDRSDYSIDAQSTFIILATGGPVRNELANATGEDGTAVPDEVVRQWLPKRSPVLLTDDHAPVDNLLAPLFEERFRYERR